MIHIKRVLNGSYNGFGAHTYHKTHLITTDNKINLLKDEIEQINK